MLKIIAINGAPRSGKDTFVEAVYKNFKSNEILVGDLSMKAPLIHTALSLFSISYDEWVGRYKEDKETPWDKLNGMSQREALIWISEEVVKPKFGKSFFGKSWVNKLEKQLLTLDHRVNQSEKRPSVVVLIPDAGFKEELEVVLSKYPKEDIVMVNTIRDGFDFSKDSRSLITGESLGITGYTLENTSTLEEFEEKCVSLFKEIIGHEDSESGSEEQQQV